MFCTKCGNQIQPQSSFCPQCGNRITPAEPQGGQPAQASTAPAAEAVVWVFSAQRKFSMFKLMPCYIVFMQDKAVLAYLAPAMQKAESARASQDIKSEGLGFFKGSAAMLRFWANYSKKYYTMTTQAILAEDPSNTVLYYRDISKVLFQCETLTSDSDGTYGSQGKLQFWVTGGETIKFTHTKRPDKSIKETLTGLFGAKLKYKK